MEDPPASDGENGGARMPGEPAEESEEGPWSGDGRDCKEGEGDPRDEREDSRAPLASCSGLFSSPSWSPSSSPPLVSNCPLAGTVLPS